MQTKAIQLTIDEIQAVIQYHARQINNSDPYYSEYIERMKYLDKRMKDFEKEEIKGTASATDWGKNNGENQNEKS